MEYTGLVFEFIFLIMGIYLYLFAIGKITPKDPKARERGETFRKANERWLRIGSLLLVAIMLVNVVLHIMDLMK